MAEEPSRSVLALDNVALELPVASVGSRVLAGCLDYLVVIVLTLIWVVAGIALSSSLGVSGAWAVVLIVVGVFLIDWGYFAGFELLLRGRTPGKSAVGLNVVARSGAAAPPGSLLARNLVRSVDVLVGVPLMAVDPLARRLGDRVGGTLVVHAAQRGDEQVARRLPNGWGAAQVAVAESLLRRGADLEPERARSLAERLLALAERAEPGFLAAVPDGDPIERLRRALEAGNR